MRTLGLALIAAAGLAIAAPAPAAAQEFYVGGRGGGVGIDIGGGGYRDYDRPRYRGDYDRPRYRAYQGYDRSYASDRGCRTVTIERDDGSVRRIRRCG